MKSPTERRDSEGELPRDARDLLRRAARPVPPTAAERAAMAAMAARIAAVPLPPGPRGAWSKLAALGGGKGVGIAGLVLAVGGATWLGATMLGGGGAQESATQAVSAGASATSKDEAAAPGGAERAAALPEATPENGASPAAKGDGQSAKEGSPRPETGSLAQGSAGPEKASRGAPPSAGAPGSAGPSGAPAAAKGVAAVKGVAGVKAAPARAEAANAVPAGSGAGKPAPAAPVSACPAGPAQAGDRAAEGPILAAAAKAIASSPLVTLACIQTLSSIGGPFQLRDEHAFLGFEASRRLGRDADAKRFARALLRASPGSAYAAKAKAYLGDGAAP